MKPRLLVVPHVYAENIRVREIELARRLVDYFEVSCLRWDDALHAKGRTPFLRRCNQAWMGIKNLLRRPHTALDPSGMTLVQLPILQPVILRRLAGDARALAWSRAFNSARLTALLRTRGITHLLFASDFFEIPSTGGLRSFFDFVDWFPEEFSDARRRELVRSNLQLLKSRVTGIFAVSESLAEKLKRDYGLDAVAVPNGADIAILRAKSSQDEAARVRQRWGLAGKYVIGYIGNHEPFAGVDFLVEVHRAVRERMSDAVAFIVGPADYWIGRLGDRLPGVVFTGAIPPAEISAYFNAIDVGVLPKDKDLGTEFAFQLKVVEYSACRRFVVAPPLETWRRLNWPNVRLVDRTVTAWADAICELRAAKWSPAWDSLAAAYDWTELARKMSGVMLGQDAPTRPPRDFH
jgi:glycosyltransferase involved in cell wall biosynthesis